MKKLEQNNAIKKEPGVKETKQNAKHTENEDGVAKTIPYENIKDYQKNHKSESSKIKEALENYQNEQELDDDSLNASLESRKHVMRNLPRTKGSIKKRLRPQNIPRSNVERRRRVRCHECEPCTRDDCGECKYCKDMKKFGGTGISKQCCLSKQCMQPFLPTTTTCMLCDSLIDRYHPDETNLMFECEICFEIYHELCFRVIF